MLEPNGESGPLNDKPAQTPIPLPDTLIRQKQLDPSHEQLLFEQWQEFNRVKNLPPPKVNPLLTKMKDGKPVFTQGTLLHGTTFDKDKLLSIKEKGILSGEFIGIPEDSETHYCADFCRVPEDMTVERYQNWINESEYTGVRQKRRESGFLANSRYKGKKVSFVVDVNQPDIANLLKMDAFKDDVDPGVLNILNEAYIHGTKVDRTNIRLAAIVCGIPANFINGIVVTPDMSAEEITFLRSTFGDYILIYSTHGHIIPNRSVS